MSGVRAISAITLGTHDMPRALRFWRDTLGLRVVHGGDDAELTSLAVGGGFVNLIRQGRGIQWSWWGRVILHVDDVDATYRALVEAGYDTDGEPADAPWGERYVHVLAPDGHEVSIAKPLSASPLTGD